MTSDDWRDKLSQLKADLPEGDGDPTPAPETAPDSRKADRLDISGERKGRSGKVATIIAGFTCPDDEVAAVATRLKQQLGAGGSARGGEILIQGDRAKDVLARLTAMGFRARII